LGLALVVEALEDYRMAMLDFILGCVTGSLGMLALLALAKMGAE
jgi:hypothetical protein